MLEVTAEFDCIVCPNNNMPYVMLESRVIWGIAVGGMLCKLCEAHLLLLLLHVMPVVASTPAVSGLSLIRKAQPPNRGRRSSNTQQQRTQHRNMRVR